MNLHPVFGHRALRDDLAKALRADRLPQVMLFTGDQGVGKQRLGLWLAQLALCSAADQEPCTACPACRRVAGLSHPDFHWLVPIPRPKAGDSDKQVEEVRETLGEMMSARREQPLYSRPDGMAMHGVASARLLLRLTSLTTVEGGRRVVLIGDADRLVAQESSPEAANALLKLLEEPPSTTTFVLTTTDATRVLPTIRSRAVPVRVGRLSQAELDEALAALLPKEPAAERRRRVSRAGGSLGRALEPVADGRLDSAVADLLEAAREAETGRWERSLRQGPWSARGEFTDLLDRLAETLGAGARAATTGEPLPEALGRIDDPRRLLAAYDRVMEARESAQGNVNPQLLLAVLTEELGEALWT
jgi:DNA polymerase-3 subunit delta'